MRYDGYARALLSLVALAIAAPAAAQSIDGSLVQRETHRPVAGAAVLLLDEGGGSAAQTQSDAVGHFDLRAPVAGVYRLRIERAGYPDEMTPAVELRDTAQVALVVPLSADTVRLAPIKVVAHDPKLHRSWGRDGGAGRLITREQIEQERPFVVTDLLRRVAGLTIVPSLGFGYRVYTASGCAPVIYLNGLRFPLLGETIDDIVSPMDLDAIEVYTNVAEVPPEYSEQGRACAAILLWTRPSERGES